MFAPVRPPRPPLRRRFALAAAAALVVGAGCWADSDQDDAARRSLLQTLPRDRRADLLDDLHRFDLLPAAEQTAIRRLDFNLGQLPAGEQARFRALIQHYHVWFQGLTEEQRASLRATEDPEQRVRLAQQLRAATAAKGRRPGSRIAGLRSGDFGLVGPFEMAGFLQSWATWPPERQAASSRKPWPALQGELRAAAKALRPQPEQLPADQRDRYDTQLADDPEFRPLILGRVGRVEQAAISKKPEAVRKAENALHRFEDQFAQFLYFEDHPRRGVAPDRLARFAETSPEWLRAQTDSLSPDDAQAYYTILYRLIYPPGKEIADPAPATTKPAPSKPAPARTGPVPSTL